ncbi:hypothetical protein N0V92_007268 [Colletotrichum tropicale]|nr:hypothetical protein N0V92_007268 [Colletotrichum tropicale]
MCQQLEELLVCCSSVCRSEEEHGIRLPLLRLIPTPDAFYVLCQKASQMGYRPDANCLGRLVLSQRPDQCPDYRAAPDAKTNNILSWTASRDIMTRSNFPTHIHCAACLGIGHGGVVNIQPAYMQPIGQTGAMPLHITMNVTGVRNRWIRGEWTCCSKGECQPGNLFKLVLFFLPKHLALPKPLNLSLQSRQLIQRMAWILNMTSRARILRRLLMM